MKNITKISPALLIFTVVLISSTACEKIEMSSGDDLKLVLNAYLYEDEPVTSVRLSETLPFTSSDTVFPLISGASVSIQWNGQDYPLISSDSAGYYHCPDSNLKITSGEEYSIEIVHGEDFLSAETSVPGKPDSMKLSASSITIDPDLTPWEMRQAGIADIEVTWANPEGDYFI